MGLLDDAIREHLELKRRRGADPAEVQQAEREALGPVRRQPEGADDLGYADDEQAEDLPYDASADDLDYAGEPVGSPEHGATPRTSVVYDDEPISYEDEPSPEAAWTEPPAEASAPEPAAPPAARRVDWEGAEGPPAPDSGVDTKPHEAVRPERPTPPPHAAPRGEDTAEYDVEGEGRAGEEGEDMLEETPEFLQDAPDHDRLWFEQRPPRDFNFDS